MLEVKDLHSGYGDAVVVNGVSLEVGAGEIVALLGRNGMGKTTFIRSVMGLTPPKIRSGTITWRGENLVGLRPHDIAARKIAIVPQGRRLFPSLTVTEHLTMLKSTRAKDGWTVGGQAHFGQFTLGASYRSKIEHDLDGTVFVGGLVGPLAAANRDGPGSAKFTTPSLLPSAESCVVEPNELFQVT